VRIAALHSHVPLHPSQMHALTRLLKYRNEPACLVGAVPDRRYFRVLAASIEGRGWAAEQGARSGGGMGGYDAGVHVSQECDVRCVGGDGLLRQNENRTKDTNLKTSLEDFLLDHHPKAPSRLKRC
jgi:hypothetical protein